MRICCNVWFCHGAQKHYKFYILPKCGHKARIICCLKCFVFTPFQFQFLFGFGNWRVVASHSPQSTCGLHPIFLEMNYHQNQTVGIIKEEFCIGTIKRFSKPVNYIKVQTPFTSFCHFCTKVKLELLTVPSLCICSNKCLNASSSRFAFVKNYKRKSRFT